MPNTKRLHVTPLDSTLLPLVLPEAILDKASAVSLHIIQTFPERRYGYIELPSEQADKLRRKLNGCFLKGHKMKVEEARPRRLAPNELPASEKTTVPTKISRTKTPSSGESGVLPAFELPKNRKVKRGWKEKDDAGEKRLNKRKGKHEKSKDAKAMVSTGQADCLFKTKLPVNAPITSNNTSGKAKKRKRGKEDRDVVVREFKKTTRHASWLRDPAAPDTKRTTEYIEGKGWIDESGRVVEKSQKAKKSAEPRVESKPQPEEIVRTEKTSKDVEIPPSAAKSEGDSDGEETSSSGTSKSDSDSDSADDENRLKDSNTSGGASDQVAKGKRVIEGLGIRSIEDDLQNAQVERLSISRSSGSPVPHVETQPTSAPSIEVHPLEALFKRPSTAASQSQTPKKPHLEVSTSFSFFDPDAVETGSTLLPQTPFTQQDIHHRRQRSAAPTPDTAAPGKNFGSVWGRGSIDEVDSEAEGEGEEQVTAAGPDVGQIGKMKEEKTESEFEKWFWEHRGENKRAWKRRRREAGKEKRAKERQQ